MKKIFRGVLLLMLLYLLFFPARALADARAGLLLWYRSVLPVLFPFMLLCGLMIRFSLLERVLPALSIPFRLLFGCSSYGAFAILCGFLCGFPMGAKVTCDLQREGKITEREAYFLYGFVNNLSPSFILSFLAADQMQRPAWGGLFLCNILGSALLYGLISGRKLRRSDPPAKTNAEESRHTPDSVFRADPHICMDSGNSPRHAGNPAPEKPVRTSRVSKSTASRKQKNGGQFPDIQDAFRRIDDCIYDTIENAVRLGAYIVMFSLLSGAVSLLLPQDHPASLFLISCIEVSNGVHLISGSALPFAARYVLVTVLASFGGLSALAQTVSIAGMDRRLLWHYIKSRVKITLLSLLMSLASVLFFRFFLLR